MWGQHSLLISTIHGKKQTLHIHNLYKYIVDLKIIFDETITYN